MLELHQLQMLSTASLFQLWNGDGRKVSTNALVEFFFGVVRISQPAFFIECGAKKAEASLRARKILPDARIVAFEANPENYESFSAAGEFDEHQIEYRHLAVSDHAGTVTFNIRRAVSGKPVSRNSGANSIMLRVADNVEYEQVVVPSIALDDEFCEEVAALWIDVEGASKQVISGGKKTLLNANVVLIEVEDYTVWEGQWTAETVVSHLYDFGLVPVARDFEYNGQYNILFIRNTLLHNREVRRNIEYFYSVLARR